MISKYVKTSNGSKKDLKKKKSEINENKKRYTIVVRV